MPKDKGLTKVGDLAPLFELPDIPEIEDSESVKAAKRLMEVARADAHAHKQPTVATGEIPYPQEDFCQLDLWPEPERGSPNAFLRSALFAAIQSEHRQQIAGEQVRRSDTPPPVAIASQRGLLISYKGQQLDQYDLDVWLQAIHYARAQPIGTECLFHGHAFLKDIGRSRGEANYDVLIQSLTRLTEGLVVIKYDTVTFTGHLVSSFTRDDATGKFKVTFNEEILKLFGRSSFTRIQWDERCALKGKALALWVHGFYASHAKPYPLTVDYLRRLCGSRNTAERSFKAALKRAFSECEKATDGRMKGIISGDMVTVHKLPSGSQAKHLAAQSTTGRRS